MAQKQTFRIRECGGMECGQVDDAKPIIPHVKILSEESRNRRRYLPESVSVSDYEGKAVNLNHPEGPNKSRIVQERFGWFEGVVKEGADWFGNLHYNPEHPYAKQFAWWAKNNPSMVGMSHDAVGQGRTENGVFIVEKVVEVKSVDLVADPATTKGLFEAMEPDITPAPGDQELDDLETHVKNAIGALVSDKDLDMKAKVKKIKAALKLLEEPGAEDEDEEEIEEDEEDEEKDKEMEESVKAALAKPKGKPQIAALKKVREAIKARAKKRPSKTKGLREELDAVKTKLALKERKELVDRLIAEAKLPALAVSADFLELLTEAKDEARIKKLIADRKALASIQKPRSTGPITEGAAKDLDNKTFAKSLKG